MSQTLPKQYVLAEISQHFPLSWSHYVLLLSTKSEYARRFYEEESLRGGWSVRQLNWMHEDENPPVGLILCDKKNDAVAHYTLSNLPNKVLAAEYKMLLPEEKLIEEEIRKTHMLLNKRISKRKKS